VTKTHPLDYFFVSRPTLFYPVWTFFLAGYWGALQKNGSNPIVSSSINLWFVLLGITLVMGGVFILNQIQDVETDRENRKLFLLANGLISIQAAVIEAVLLALIGLVLGFAVSFIFGLGILILLILSGWLYNFPPFIWKDKPFWGMMVNVTGGWLIYLLGWNVLTKQVHVPAQSTGYALACAAVFLNTTLPDIEGDKTSGKITFGVKLGVQRTIFLAMVFESLALLFAFFTEDKLLLMTSVLVLPFFVFSVFRPTVPNAVRATKFSIFIMAMVVSYFFPYFLIPVWTIFFGAMAYYRWRFKINYPNFKSSASS